MSDKIVRHFIALLGTLVCSLAFWAGYKSGINGWWWSSVGVFIIYAIIFKLIDV